MPAKRSGIEALRFTSSLTLSCTRIGSTAPRQRTPLCLLSNAHGRARREDEKRRSTGGSLYASVAKLCGKGWVLALRGRDARVAYANRASARRHSPAARSPSR
eukprot:606203-Prymnesium_polylepis.1